MSAFQEQTNQYVEEIRAGSNSILVAIRVRPLSQKQRKISVFQTVRVLQGKLLSVIQPQSWSPVDVLRKNRTKQIQYAFDFVFDQQVATRTIYQETVSILLQGLLQGYNASVLAYGATSCGKTYTMIGQNQNSAGIMAMAVLELLNIASQKKKYQDIKLKASYVQIYNQNIKDLLTSEDKNLEIRQDPKQGVSIFGGTQVLIDNINQLKTVLKVGNRNRTMQSTGCNEVSSRSHGIFQIHLQIKNKAQSTIDQTIVSKLFLIDLAGSERASNTTNKGMRMVQGAKINQSLLVLGNCIQALSQASQKGLKNAFVPYRGSKLTRLLKDSLGGNCRTVMIAHIAPALNLFEQTYNTLVYAHRAKNIKNNPIRNTLVAQTHLSNYVNVINNLKRQNEQLKNQIKQKQLLSINRQRGSYNKNNSSLPVLQNQAYNEEINKYQMLILKQFSQQDVLATKICQLQLKIQTIAFSIYQKQLFGDYQSQKIKSTQAAQLTKQKIKYEKKLQQKIQARNNIIRQIQRNQVIGSSGINHLKNSFKQKKVESALKNLKAKQEIIKKQKKYIDVFIQKMKKSMRNKQDSIEKQKVLIKKNNIISRITYSQLDFAEKNDSNSVKSQRKSQQKLPKQISSISYKKLRALQTKRNQQDKIKNELSLTLDARDASYSNPKQKIKKLASKQNKKTVKLVDLDVVQHNTSPTNQQSIKQKISPKFSQKKAPTLKKQKKTNQNISNKSLRKNKSSGIGAKFDFIYLPH